MWGEIKKLDLASIKTTSSSDNNVLVVNDGEVAFADELFVSGLNVTGDFNISGRIFQSGEPFVGGGGGDLTSVTTNVIPEESGTLDLGTASKPWRDLYVTTGTIYLGEETITVENEKIVFSKDIKVRVGADQHRRLIRENETGVFAQKTDLEATGENLLGQITSNDSDLSNVASNLVSSGQNLQTQITSNDADILTNVGSIATNATNIASNTTNLAATGQTLQQEKLNVMGGTISGEILPYESGAVNLGSPLLPFRSGYFDDLIVSADSIQIGPDTTLSATAEGGMSFNTVGTITFGDVVVTGDLGVSGDFTLGDTTTDRITTRGDLFVLDDAFFADAVEITGSLTVDGTASAATPTQNSHLTTKLYVDTDITIVSGLITNNDTELNSLRTATGVLKTSTDNNATNIASNDSDISTLTTNLASTGQNLQANISTNVGAIASNVSDISTLTTNLASTGNNLQAQVTSNDGDISTLTSNLISTGQTLQTQITSNDSDISTITSNLVSTGQTLNTDIITVSGLITNNDTELNDIRTATGVLKTSTDNNATNIASNDSDIATLTTNLTATGSNLQAQVTSLSGDAVLLAGDQTVAGNKTFSNDVTVLGDLAVSGDFTLGDATTDRITTRGDLYVEDDAVFQDDITVTGDAHFAGSVGIGTAAPTEILEVVSDSDPTILIRPVTVDSANSGKISYRENAGGTTGVDLRYDGANNKFIIDTSDVSNALVIKRTDGKVGIGTTSPSYSLHVVGDGYFSNDLSLATGKTFDIGTITRLTDNGNSYIGGGNVGIGTTNPTNPLYIHRASGSTYSRINVNDASNVGHIIGNSNELWYAYVIGAGTYQIWNNSGANFNITPAGRVGVGTTAPNAALSVYGTDFHSSSLELTRTGDGQDDDAAIRFNRVGTVGNGERLGGIYFYEGGTARARIRGEKKDTATGEIGFQVSTSSKAVTNSSADDMTLTPTGLGLGTNIPYAKLHVVYTGTSTTNAEGLFINNISNTTGHNASVIFSNDSGQRQKAALAYVDTGTYGSGDLVFALSPDNSTILNIVTHEKMRIKLDGKVGIGTTAPTTLFQSDVNSASVGTDSITARNRGVTTIGHTVGYGYQFNSAVPAASRAIIENINSGLGRLGFFVSTDATAGNLTEYLSIKSDGKVGIGITSPAAPLSVKGAADSGFRLYKSDGTTIIAKIEGTGSEHGSLHLNNNAGAVKIGFNTNGVSYFNGGNLAIGAGSASEKLQIHNGSILMDSDWGLKFGGSNAMIEGNSSGTILRFNASAGFKFTDGGTTRLLIDTNGSSTFSGLVTVGAAGAGYDAMFHSTTAGQYMEWDASMSLTRYRDNTKAVFGNGDDLQIFHDGNSSFIKDTGTGGLYLYTNTLAVTNAAGNENMIYATENGAVTLYHNNAVKLATTSTGVSITGQLSATTKSFLIDHPTKPGKKLRHGSLEGPENGVYIRGRGDNNIIELPEYWTELVNKDSITVQLTPIGKHQHIYVEKIQNNTVYIQSDEARKSLNDLEYYYLIIAERKDVDKLTIEE